MTGMRVGTVSELVNGKGISINKVQPFAVMAALRVTKMSDIYEIVLPETQEETFNTESSEWINDKEMPTSVKEMYKNNILKTSGINF